METRKVKQNDGREALVIPLTDDGITPEEMEVIKQIARALPVIPIPTFSEDFEMVTGKEFKRYLLNTGALKVKHIVEDNFYPMPKVNGFKAFGYLDHLAGLQAAFNQVNGETGEKLKADGVEQYKNWVHGRDAKGRENYPHLYKKYDGDEEIEVVEPAQ